MTLDVSDENAVTIAGGVFDSFQSVLPDSEEVDIVGEGSFILRYEDDALAWNVVDGGRWNYLVEVLDEGSVIAVGSYDDDLQPVFGAGTPQEVSLPPTFGEGMYVARYSQLGTFEWVLAASDGNPGAIHSSLDPSGSLHLLGLATGGTVFQPDGESIEPGYFRATYTLDGLGVSLQPGPFAYEAPPDPWSHNLYVTGPEFWPNGSSAFVGTFCGTLLVAPGDDNATEIVSEPPYCADVDAPSTNDGIIVRYQEDGSLDWLLAPLTPGYAGIHATHVTSQGRIVVVGHASDDLELIDTHDDVRIVEGPTDFVAAFEQDGALAWVRRIETSYTSPSIAVDPDGGVIAVGLLLDSFVFEPGTERQEVLTGPGIYGVRYDSEGEPQWASMLLEGQTYWSNLLVSAGDGAFAVSGGFEQQAVLLPGGPDERVLEAEVADLFVALFELG
jgi:hypothetical protein